jgi:hypothetical protein
MNKLAFTLGTLAALSLSSAVFAQTYTASTPQRDQSAQSQTHVKHHVKKRHHAATSKIATGHERGLHEHYGSKNKKVVTKRTPAAKAVKTKVAS